MFSSFAFADQNQHSYNNILATANYSYKIDYHTYNTSSLALGIDDHVYGIPSLMGQISGEVYRIPGEVCLIHGEDCLTHGEVYRIHGEVYRIHGEDFRKDRHLSIISNQYRFTTSFKGNKLNLIVSIFTLDVNISSSIIHLKVKKRKSLHHYIDEGSF